LRKHRITYQPLAQKDLIDIFDYLKIDSPIAAAKLLDQMDKAIARLNLFPSRGIRPRDSWLKSKGYRILIVGDYLVFYVASTTRVQIRRVIHGKRDYSFLFHNRHGHR